MRSSPILVALLNGGASSRFGEDKSLVVVDGRPLINHLIAAAEDVSAQIVIVGRRPPFEVSIPVLLDAEPGAGPLGAILQAFAFAPDHALLILPCDLARVTAAHLRALAAPLPANSDGRVPRLDSLPSPIPGFYAPSAHAAFAATYASGRRALYPALRDLDLEYLTTKDLEGEGLDPRGLHDFDSPSDLAGLRTT